MQVDLQSATSKIYLQPQEGGTAGVPLSFGTTSQTVGLCKGPARHSRGAPCPGGKNGALLSQLPARQPRAESGGSALLSLGPRPAHSPALQRPPELASPLAAQRQSQGRHPCAGAAQRRGTWAGLAAAFAPISEAGKEAGLGGRKRRSCLGGGKLRQPSPRRKAGRAPGAFPPASVAQEPCPAQCFYPHGFVPIKA